MRISDPSYRSYDRELRDDLQSELKSDLPPVTTGPASLSLDDLFRRTLALQPNAVALIDPPNKLQVCGQRPLQLTYAEADCAISHIAKKFQDAELPAGSIVAVQLPNTIEFPITLLAAMRAGLVVALLPQLWRQADLTEALNKIGARAIVSTGHIEIVDHADLAMNAAAETFSIRRVFGFGKKLPEGMTPLDVETKSDETIAIPAPNDAQRLAVVSFDVTAEGLCAIPRNHAHLIAGALAIVLESAMPTGGRILSTVAPCSFGGLVASVVSWLLSSGSLALCHAGALHVLEQEIAAGHHTSLVAPAALALRLAGSDVLAEKSSIKHVIGLWRAPERMSSSDDWSQLSCTLTDVCLFGEIGLVASTRAADGSPAMLKSGLQLAPRAGAGGRIVGELTITPKGTLGMKGAMVPLQAYLYATTTSVSDNSRVQDHVDTGYAARTDRKTGVIDIVSPPGGLYAVGGYRFLASDLDQWAKRLGEGTTLAALPDNLNSHRLAGRAPDTRRVREVLGKLGLNPLLIDAFRERAAKS